MWPVPGGASGRGEFPIDSELRIRDWRVFYRVVDETVQVVLVGRKSGHYLIIDRRRFIL